jgi:hypothetical protein
MAGPVVAELRAGLSIVVVDVRFDARTAADSGASVALGVIANVVFRWSSPAAWSPSPTCN